MLKRVIKILASGLLGVVALSLVLILALVSINLFDEDIDPNLKKILSSNELDIPDSQNAFFSMVALTAPAGEDIHNAGIRAVNEYQKSRDEAGASGRETLDDLLGSDALEFAGDFGEACFPKKGPPCMRFCCASRTALTKLTDANQELLRRYESLYEYPYYHESSETFFGLSDVLRIHRLKLAEVADSFTEGKTNEALQAIQKDIGFWRRLLGSEMNAIMYSVVGIAISNNLNLLSESLLTAKLTDSDRRLIQDVLLPLTDAEKSVHGVMVAEIRQLHKFNRRLPNSYAELAPGIQSSVLQEIVVQIFYRPNATLNFSYSEFARMIRDRDSLPYPADSSYWTSDRELDAAEYLYNPIGKIITDWVRRYPFALDASFRADARYRLIELQLKLRDSEIPESKVNEFLVAAPAYFTNPFTGEKIQWEGDKKRLVIRVPHPRYPDEIWVEYCDRPESPMTSQQADKERRLGYCA